VQQFDSVTSIEPQSGLDRSAHCSEECVCPACGEIGIRTLARGTDRLYHTTSKTFLIVECARCRLIRLHPWPASDELNGYYPENYWFVPEAGAAGKLAEWYRRWVISDHVRFVRRATQNANTEGVVLDVGCGGGLFLRLLAERGVQVLGLDSSHAAARVASSINGIPAICGELRNSPLRPGSCAAITMFHVLEHLYDPAAYIDEAKQLLKPDGRLIVQVPNAACWQFLLFGERWNGIDIPRHLIHFRGRDLRALLEDCGFEILREKQFSWRDNPAGLATSIAPSLDPMARRIRCVIESKAATTVKDLLYFLLVAGSWPLAMLEAACGQGATIMVEARKKT
jgi:SAM-dependent methyltransferase